MKLLYRNICLVVALAIFSSLTVAQDTANKKPILQANPAPMKKVLLLGRLGSNIPTADKITAKSIELFSASTLADVKSIFEKNNNKIDIVIMGAGIELETRLEIIRYVFSSSNITTVHMKDVATGPEGFLPFINRVLNGLLKS